MTSQEPTRDEPRLAPPTPFGLAWVRWWRRWWSRLVVGAVSAVVGLGVGFGVRSLLPPFVLDDPFWRAFWSGAPAAGLFAVFGALIALIGASVAAGVARVGARRTEWWNRAEWALNLSVSDQQADRVLGLLLLKNMRIDATQAEQAMIVAVTSSISAPDEGEPVTPAEEPVAPAVDTPSVEAENGGTGGGVDG